ncbi:MAG: TonB-dependent receptor, partial [Bacteroidetes bacterium]|nr:TonB-dependent receptor [Bacteroidota bacterium]
MIRRALILLSVFQSLLSFAQTPDSTHLFSEPISFSNPVISLPFVTVQRSYDPYYINKMEFKEPFGLRVKGGGLNAHRFLLNGIPVNNRLYNDIPLTDGSISLDKGWLSGRTPGQSSGVFVITQPLPGKTISSALELSGGTYFSSDNDLYPQRTKLDNLGNKNLKYSVSGPVPFVENLSFSTDGMFSQDGGYLSGANLYKTWEGLIENDGRISPSGDSSGVMMNDFNRRSLSFRLLWKKDIISTDFFILYNRKAASYYSFAWLLTPEGNLRHYQEQIISGITSTLKWSDSFTQTLKLSYQPTQTWGYLAPDINGTAYIRSYTYGGTDIDLFYSNTGGYENRRYRYHDNLFLFSMENTYKWNDSQESSLSIQSENWWYFEEKGFVQNKSTSSFPPQLYFSGYTFNNHPSLYSLTASHRLNVSLVNLPLEAETGFRIESYKSDGREYTNDPTYNGTKLKQYVSDENPDAIIEFLPFFTGNAGLLESLRLNWSFNQSVDWPSYSDLYSGEYLKSFEPDLSTFIGNGGLKPEKWVTAQVGVEWNPFKNLLFTLDAYKRSSKRLKFQDVRYGVFSVGTSNNAGVSFQGLHASIYYISPIPENPIINTFSVS